MRPSSAARLNATLSHGPYVVELADGAGMILGQWYADDLIGLLAAYGTAKEAHPEVHLLWRFGNLDLAEAGYSGLSDEEEATLYALGLIEPKGRL